MAFEMEELIGSGSVQELVCQFVNLPAPAEEVKDIRKTVIIDNCKVVFDKVILDGRLRKDIMFKAANAGFELPGNVEACGGIVGSIAGPIQDIDVDIAFNALIPVPGARPTDKCVVLQAFVEGEKEEAANINPNGAFNVLIDKSIIFVCVKVVRDTITNGITTTGVGATGAVTTTNQQMMDMVCPQRRSTGFFPGGDGTIPRPQPGLIPGTWIGPTLIFPGVLNPGRATTLPLRNPVANTNFTQVQVTPAVTTPTTGAGTDATGLQQ